MSKKIIINIIVIVTVILGSIGYNQYNNHEGGVVYAKTYRDGISLVPTKIDSTGIAVDTDFKLTFDENNAMTLEEIKDSFRIEPEVKFNIKEENDHFLIKFEEQLNENELYKFYLGTASFVYQTETAFSVIGTLPSNESTYVPIDTGIEMLFSHEGAELEGFFDIAPMVKGTFEAFGNTVVFLPEQLEPETLYTVTLKKGLKLTGSKEVLEEDYQFSFETSYNDSGSYEEAKGYFAYSRMLNDFSTTEKLYIPMNYSVNVGKTDKEFETTIYRYETIDVFEKAVRNYMDRPFWTSFNRNTTESISDGLDQVIEFEQTILEDYSNNSYLEIPVALESGFYLVQSKWEDVEFQTFVQVTDLSRYYFEDIENSYFWLNDLKNNEAAVEASIAVYGTDTIVKTNEEGIAIIPNTTEEDLIFYNMTYQDQQMLGYRYTGNQHYGEDYYWKYFQTDRNLYQPNDDVMFFGFLQNRETGISPDEVTVEILEQSWYYGGLWPSFNEVLPLVKETITLDGGFYKGTLVLPYLDEGSYQVQVKLGDKLLVSNYIQVDQYVKPDYKMDVTKDKEAIFIGETVNFTATTKFFEGTPVSNLVVNYNINGLEYTNGTIVTDEEGDATVPYILKDYYNSQGEVYGGFSVYATLPESGELYGNESVRIFVNDVNVDLQTSLEEGIGKVEVQVDTITLDRLNDKTAENRYDFLDQPVEEKVLTGTVYRNEWIKEALGEYYDYINKVVKKTYDYHLEVTEYQAVELITDTNGFATIDVVLPKELNISYSLELNTVDNQNRKIELNGYFSDYRYYGNDYEDERVRILLDKESYRIGDEVTAKIIKKEMPMAGEEYLMIFASNGVKHYEIVNKPEIQIIFEKRYMPNVQIIGVTFTGDAYVTSESENIRVMIEDFNIVLEVKTDQESYKPGDEVTVNIAATYKTKDGEIQPVVDGVANISIVDEALFALSDQQVDTLGMLYGQVSSGLYGLYGSHDNSGYEQGPIPYYVRGSGIYNEVSMVKSDEMATLDDGLAVTETAVGSSGNIAVRSEFKDTALFVNLKLDAKGKGKVTFKLPDNVTEWRLTTSALSEALLAGSEVTRTNVSLPFFVNTSLNTTYLVGDKPYAGVVGYGNELLEDEAINYTLICEALDYKVEAVGKAYEKVDLPLWLLEEGDYEVTILAQTDSGYTDAYVEHISVIKSYQEMTVSDTYDGVPGLKITTNESGMTTLTFADKSKGMYLPNLYSLFYNGGKRVDQTYVSYVAGNMLKDGFDIKLDAVAVSLSDYITNSGGISLLPYSEADIETTVKMIPFIENAGHRSKVKSYLYNQLYDKDLKDQSAVIYGLLLMGEPVLLQLNNQAMIDNLEFEDYVYIAMSYLAVGDEFMATRLYNEEIKPYIEVYDERSRVIYSDDKEEQIRHSSMVLPLVAGLDIETSITEGLYNYVNSSYSKTYLTNLDCIQYIKTMMMTSNNEEAKLTYKYDGESHEVEFGRWYGKSITIPSSKMGDFEVVGVTSDVMVVANYNRIGLLDQVVDSNVFVNRHFEDYKTGETKLNFKQGDIVKVVIDWEVTDQAIDNYYTVTDYAPSGLVPIKNVWNYGLEGLYYWYRDVDGQSVSFGAYKQKDKENYRPLFYYARIVSPGTFTADATIIQGAQIEDSFNIGETATIVIE